MSLPADLQRFAPIAAAAVLAVAALFFVSQVIGGGSGGSGGGSAQQTIEKAFGAAPQDVKGGRVTGSVTVSVSGAEAAAAGLSRPFAMTVDGIGNNAGPGKPSSFDIGVKLEGAGERHTMHVISTGRQGFIDVDGRAYKLPPAQFKQLTSGQGKSNDATALKTLGVDPRSWIRNPTDAGTAMVGGEQTTHVTADVDVPLMFDDVLKAAERSGQAQQIPAEGRDAIRKAVKDAQIEVYASKKDGSLRRFVATAHFQAPGPEGKELAGDVRFDLQVSEVGKPQKIVAPRNAAPISSFDQSSLGLGGLSGFSGATTRSTPAPKPAKPAHSGSGKRSKPAGQTRQAKQQAYVSCVQQADSVPALNKCQSLLP